MWGGAYAAGGTIASLCDPRTAPIDPGRVNSAFMEWVLQVIDEVDDAIGALQHGRLGLNAQVGVLVGIAVVGAVGGAALAVGQGAMVACGVTVTSVVTAVRIHRLRGRGLP